MKVTVMRESLVQACQLVASVPFDRSTGSIVYTLHSVSQLTPSPILWPAPGEDAVEIAEKRREFSRQLEQYFHDIRCRARESCPPALLPCFEEQLCEIEATVRATVTGRLSPFADLSYHIRQVEEFGRRWLPCLEPPLPPPPRVRYDAPDRSVWVDGKCLARELDRKQFGFVRALADAYPDPVTWNVIAQSGTGCRGGNQTRVYNSLPPAVRDLVESGSDGYAMCLPAKLSTAV